MTRFLRAVAVSSTVLGLSASVTGLGCVDQGKVSENKALEELGKLAPVVKEDVGEVRRGMPAGATKLASLLEPDPGNNLPGLQRAIQSARSSVKDLDVAKSTFF